MRAKVEVESFPARFDGHCFECEGGIHRGQRVCRDDEGRPRHVECPKPKPICQICWLEEPCEHTEAVGGR
jgi:hypothetical protein